MTLGGKVKEYFNKLEEIKPFSETEAWQIFRVTAIAEAVGWTILIIGVSINKYGLPGKDIAVPIAGQIHGTIFMVYFGVLIVTYTSLRWSRQKFLLALIAGVPPYGSLIFEQFAARKRKSVKLNEYYCSVVLSVVSN
jgi:integral membrane protein